MSECETLPQKMLKYVEENAKLGDVKSVVDAIDSYCYKYEPTAINIGDIKGKIVDDIITEHNPKTVLELGTFAGYSAIRFASLLDEGARYVTLEASASNAAVAREMIKYAGLQDRVTVLEGNSSDTLTKVSDVTGVKCFDLVFIDHAKELYKPDTLILENLGLIRPGTILVADNAIYPGCPDYLEYVRNSPKFKCTTFMSKLEYSERDDAVEKSIYMG